MTEAANAAEAPLLQRNLPDAIVIWEILVRLPPKSLLRCRAVCRAWRGVTSTRSFLLVHHDRQPNLPVIYGGCDLLAFDHQAADGDDDQLHTVARFDEVLYPQASCDGLLVLASSSIDDSRISICNPATRQHAWLGTAEGLSITGMYVHRPTGEYRLLLHRIMAMSWMPTDLLPEGHTGCYVFAVGSDLPPRYIGWPEVTQPYTRPALLRDNLHWYPSLSQAVIVFDTIAETFRQMRVPIDPRSSFVFEMDGTLGIYNRNHATQIVDIWVLQDYESEVWDFKYRIRLPVAEIRRRFEAHDVYWAMDVVPMDGGVLLLVSFGRWLLRVDSDGKLVDSFHRGGQDLNVNGPRLKQALIPHTFFTSLRGYAVNASPFI